MSAKSNLNLSRFNLVTNMGLDDSEAVTARQLFKELIHKFRKQKIEDAEISARWIVEEAVGLTGADFFTKQDEKLTVRMVAAADSMSDRRIKGEPLQYVVGHWGFRELDLAVDHRALIPRPETESVVEKGIQYLKSLTSSNGEVLKVVELGTGTGAIALSIAKEVPETKVHATDVSAEALSLTRSNLAGLGRAARNVSLCEGSWFDPLPDALRGELDLIVSNPPYVSESDELPLVVKDWEPGLALFAEANGFAHLLHIAVEARSWLKPNGMLLLECAEAQCFKLKSLLISRGYEKVTIGLDLAGRERMVSGYRPANDISAEHFSGAMSALKSGKFVVTTTDTVPGILAAYSNSDAVITTYVAKGRPLDQPMPVLVSGIEQALQLVEFSDKATALAREHWPGPLTLVATRLDGPDPVHKGNTLGVRVPDLGWLRLLIDEVGPVTGSSANVHDLLPENSAEKAAASLHLTPGYVVPGSSETDVASTVLDVTKSEARVLRLGAIDISDQKM